MDVVLQAALIGLLQGLTEFIPVSSSAHLELAPWIFGWETDGLIGSLAFDVFLHLGTLVALLVYFARDWIRYVGAWLASIRERRIGDDPDRRIAWLLIVATIPAALIGFGLEGLHRGHLPRGRRRRTPRDRRLPGGRRARPVAGRSAREPATGAQRRDDADGADDRRGPGARALPRHQPIGSDDHRRPAPWG